MNWNCSRVERYGTCMHPTPDETGGRNRNYSAGFQLSFLSCIITWQVLSSLPHCCLASVTSPFKTVGAIFSFVSKYDKRIKKIQNKIIQIHNTNWYFQKCTKNISKQWEMRLHNLPDSIIFRSAFWCYLVVSEKCV